MLTGKLEHLRIAEIRDTLHPRREHAVDAARLAEFNVRSALACGLSLNGRVNGFIALFSSQPRKEGWDANLHLMLKLVGSSFATGLERLRVQRYLGRLEERNALSLPAANDGMWDFDVENNTVYYSPRWRKMLGYDEHDANVTPDWRRLVHPDDLARVQAMIRDHIAGKTPMFESVHARRAGRSWRRSSRQPRASRNSVSSVPRSSTCSSCAGPASTSATLAGRKRQPRQPTPRPGMPRSPGARCSCTR